MTSHETLASLVGPGRYNAVVRIDLFTDVYDWNKGWKMGLAANYESVLENCTAVRVAPIGVFNVGKTWLIKKLCGEPSNSGLLSGESSHTEGLSIKVSDLDNDVRRCVFLDTAGLNSPVTSVRALGHMLGLTDSDPMKAMDNMLQELKRHENFIRQVAFEFAQVYLLVVGQISHRDQLELLQLIQLAEKYGAKKQVIVVHNLKKMTYKDFTSAAKYDSFTPDAKPITYLQAMQNVYKLEVNHPTLTSRPGATIDVLYSKFGDGDRAVQIRHLFLTGEGIVTQDSNGKPDPDCNNDVVLEYLRTLIQSASPTTGNILADIAKIATDCAKSMVRLPPGKNIEIRFHKGRGVLLGGEVTEAEAKQMADWAKRPPKSDELAKAEAKVAEYKLKAESGPLTDAEREEMDAADAHLSLTLVEANSGKETEPMRDAETLKPIKSTKGEITCRPVALGATAVMSGDGHVKYNVSRVRAMANGQPHWIVLVHLTIPGLAPGELEKLRDTLRWDEGLTMAPETPQAVDTLKLQFTARIVSTPVKQLDSLNKHGMGQQGRAGGTIRIDATHVPVVIEAGNRPFPTPATTQGPAKQSNGTYALDILVHTKVESCSWEIEPILSYSRGVLTVMVCAEPSEDERSARENQAWIEEGCGAFDFGEYVKNTGGSDDDLTA